MLMCSQVKMSSVHSFIIVLLCLSCVMCKKKLCDINDNKCLTQTIALGFPKFVKGVPGVEPSDPLRVDLIETKLPTIWYKVVDGTLTGMKECHVEFVQLTPKEKKYFYHIACPHLFSNGKCEMKGMIGTEHIEGKSSSCKIDYYDYHLLFNGDYELNKCNDGNTHMHLKTFNLEIDVKGRVRYEFDDLFNGDKAKSDAVHKFANANWQFVDKLIRQELVEAFMKKYIDNVNDYLKVTPITDIFFEV